jgi:D-alanyl-D-alanine carboxypeptidase
MRKRIAGVAIGLALTAGVLAAAGPSLAASQPDSLQSQVNAVLRTGDVGVIAESTSSGQHSYAAAGTADLTTPARAADSFRIGSATKTFTSTVMLQLVAEHRLSLDDTVEHWLPGVVSGNGNDGSKITVRELLQHTSGLYDYTEDYPQFASITGFQSLRYTTYTPEQLVAIAMSHHPDFAPGTKWEYSNTNYILAGMIISKITGHSWAYEVNQRIIQPLGLRHTYVPGTDPNIEGPHLHGYSAFGSDGQAIDTTAWNATGGGAAGAIISTTSDLTRFYQALIGGNLLPHTQMAEMQTTVPAPEFDAVWPGARYGLGLMWIPLSCGGGYYSHGGDVPGYSTRDGITTDGKRVVVAERTGDGDAAGQLTSEHAIDKLVDQQLCSR